MDEMARTWTALYASVCTSKKLKRCETDSARLLFFLLLAQADAWGCLEDDAETINGLCWPMLGKTDKATELCLTDLAHAGLISRQGDGEQRWVHVTAWEKHAGKHRGGTPGARRFPGASGEIRGDSGRTGEDRGEPGESGASPSLSLSDSRSVSSSESSQTRARAKTREVVDPHTIPLPREIDTPEVRQALVEFLDARVEAKKGGWGPKLAATRIAELVQWGPERAVAALRHSAGYEGVFEPRASQGRPGASGGQGRFAGLDALKNRLDTQPRTITVEKTR